MLILIFKISIYKLKLIEVVNVHKFSVVKTFKA